MSGVQTVRKKPVEVQAIRVPTYPSDEYVSVYLYQEDAGDVASWCGGRQLMHLEDDDTTAYGDVIVTGPHIAIATLEGTMVALPGDWIIQGVQGEFYPCKPDIFAETYDVVTFDPKADALDGGRLG